MEDQFSCHEKSKICPIGLTNVFIRYRDWSSKIDFSISKVLVYLFSIYNFRQIKACKFSWNHGYVQFSMVYLKLNSQPKCPGISEIIHKAYSCLYDALKNCFQCKLACEYVHLNYNEHLRLKFDTSDPLIRSSLKMPVGLCNFFLWRKCCFLNMLQEKYSESVKF